MALALWTRGREAAARLLRLLRRRTRTARRAVEAAISVVAPSARRGSAAEAGLRGIEFGFLWVAWLGVAIAGFGGATIRLATYWDAATPAVAALAGLGAASIPSLLRRGAGTVAAVFALALFGAVYAAVAYDRAGDAAEHFGLASNIAFGFAALIAVGGAFMYFGWRPFGIHAGAAALTAAAVGAALLVGSVTVHNLLYPRDDTLGRIGFDQVAVSGVGAPEPSPQERRRQRQGGIITAIVRADVDRIDAALEYVRQRRGDSRYLLATDTYNTGARVSLLTGEPVLPLYSEYRLVREMDDAELKRLLESGDIPFILTTRDMLYMDFRLYARMIVSSIDATASAGLPPRGEYQLLEVIEGREP